MLALLTRVLLWASVGVFLWYILARIIPKKYLAWFGGAILLLLIAVSFLEPINSTAGVIWQIISFPLSPLGGTIVLLGAALSEGTKSAKGTLVAIALSILLISSIPLFAQLLVSDAERSVRNAFVERSALCEGVCRIDEVPGGRLSEATAIVVLGDSSDIDQATQISTETGTDISLNTALAPRLIYAADLYRQVIEARGAAPIVFVTAGAGGDDSDQRETIRRILSANGVDTSNVQIENTGLDIRTTSSRVESLLQDRQIIANRDVRRDEGTQDDPRIIVVAPAILMSRAALTFERRDLQVIARPTDFYTTPFSTGGDLLEQLPILLPSVDALQLTTRYWNELLTSLYYFLRGWLPNFNFGWDSSIEI
ncbi:MAG: YdcF family protein [Phormidesmis sp.]